MKTLVISFVGVADTRLAAEVKGPVVSAVSKLKPNKAVLIATLTPDSQHDFLAGAAAVRKALGSCAPDTSVTIVTLDLSDPTDHNEIYPALRDIVSKYSNGTFDVTAAISSGTPSMQVCWILLAESGDAKIRLVRTVEPELSDRVVREVRHASSLPRISALESEVHALRDVVLDPVVMKLKDGTVRIGERIVKLSPMEFSTYRFFLERRKKARKDDDGFMRVSGFVLDDGFTTAVVRYLKESFPLSDVAASSSKKAQTAADVFRTTVSKLNKKIKTVCGSPTIASYYEISGTGPKNARQYGVKLDADRITIR